MDIDMDIDDHVGFTFTPDEYEVAEILVNLPALIFDNKTRKNQRPLFWGDKKNRSSPTLENMAVDPPPTTAPTNKGPSSLDPLTLSLTQPHHKRPKLSNTKRNSNEELLEEIDELTRQKELLKMELETLRLYHETQIIYNAELKARKQKLSRDLRREEVHLKIRLTSSNPPVETNSDDHHQIPIVNVDQTASQRSQMQPVIPDLNETIWTENDYKAFDQADLETNRTTVVDEAAAARLRRRQINKMKKSRVLISNFVTDNT